MRRILALLLLARALSAGAQMWDRLASEDYRIDTATVRQLRAGLDNLSFFHDNEYSSSLTQGYSLPGLWLRPKLTYAPLPCVRLELGVHAMVFDGANKYPNYAYHDIGRWKGSQYQRGAHALPWFRAQAATRRLTVVLGDIYGGQSHGLGEPLFNAEANMSQDPEMGLQLLWDLPRLHADTWVNWQSYIFREDSHQEAFTVGASWRALLNAPSARARLYLPAQLVIQHRGGEQDTTQMGVQTVCNASLGLALEWSAGRRRRTRMRAEASALGALQQAGKLWPFDRGAALHAALRAELPCRLMLRAGYFDAPRHFVSLYGNHFFSTESVSGKGSFRGARTAYAGADYHHPLGKGYTLGAAAEAFQNWLPGKSELSFSFGVYMRVNPSFLIKQW